MLLLLAALGCGAERHENAEFGFRVDVVPGALACTGGPLEHDTGVRMILDAPAAGCDDARDPRRFIAVNASYNAMLAPDGAALLSLVAAAPCDPLSPPIALADRPTATCKRADSDGSLVVYAITQAGRWPDGAEPAPYVNYTVMLRSLPETFEDDLRALRELASSMQIRVQ